MNHATRRAFLFTIGAWSALQSIDAATLDTRPITIVVPFAAGGPSDVVTRKVAAEMAKGMNQPVVVENRPGAAGQIGTEYVVRAKPDGLTLLFLGASSSTSPSIVKSPKAILGKDLEPISSLYGGALVLMVNAALPVRTVKELAAYAQTRADGLSAGTSHSLGLLSTKSFMRITGINMTPVPYKGSSATVVDLARGEIQLTIDALTTYLPYIKTGQVRPLVVGGASRLAAIPDTPTAEEAGLAQFRVAFVSGLWAPKGTPKEAIDRLQRAVAAAVAVPEVEAFVRSNALVPRSSTPEEYAREAGLELDFWNQVAKHANFLPE